MRVIRSILVNIFTGANIATILLLWLCCGFTYLHPGTYPRLGVFTLAFPGLLLVNVLFVFFWLVFKVKRIWIPFVGLLVCSSFIRDYFPVNFPSHVPQDSTLSILSYNTRNYGSPEANVEDGTNAVVTFLINSGADIICLQESSNKGSLTDSLVAKGYAYLSKKEYTIYSKLPILSGDTLALQGQNCHAMQVFLQDGPDTIMLINQHLQSNQLSPQMKDAYRETLKKHEVDSMRKDLTPIFEYLTNASPSRAAQADTISSIIESWLPRPVIVCGDFNDTPVSYTHRVLTRHLTSAYRESGNGLGFTFQEKGFPVRIDHILFDAKHWQSHDTHVNRSISYSDHFPIQTKLTKKTR